MTGRLISTHSMVLSLPIHIDHLPERGAAVEAKTDSARPGGGFIALAVAAAQGVNTAMASPLGTGPNSFTVRQKLIDAGIEILTNELVGDIGISILLVEADGSMSSVLTSGVESEPSREALSHVLLQPGDLIHISGMDLTNSRGIDALAAWGTALPDFVTLVVSVSPAVERVPAQAWLGILHRADIVSLNVREAAALGHILRQDYSGTTIRNVMKPDAALVRRLGVMGCEVQVNESAPRIHIPAFEATTVDTAGVGDTHVGTMCASLLKGFDLVEACRAANAAAAIAISHESALPVPTQEQIDELLRD